MLILVERGQLRISRIFNRRRFYSRLLTRTLLVLCSILFIPYLILLHPYQSSNHQDTLAVVPRRSKPTLNRPISIGERRFLHNWQLALSNLTLCQELPDNISIEPLELNSSLITDIDLQLEADVEDDQIRAGGWWQPIGCLARHTTAVIIPYRDRDLHLKVLLIRLHQVLRRQLLSYRIFVIEQSGTALFNKGSLFNAAFLYIRENHGAYLSECIVLHDVDLIPEDERNLYTCPDPESSAVRHMSPGVDTLGYHLPYPQLVGGVLALNPNIFIRVNGYSNSYHGWGGEDDDLSERLAAEGIAIFRPPSPIGRYKMLRHGGRPAALNRWRLLRSTKRRYKEDGLSQMVHGRTYNIVSVDEKPTYTHIVVLLNGSSGSIIAPYPIFLLLVISIASVSSVVQSVFLVLY